MTELTYMFGALSVLAGLMTSISIWAPRRLWLKLSAVGTAAVFLPTAYASLLHLLSMPKPVELEWWHARAEQATVLGSSMQEGEGIYLWLQMRGVPEPRAYVLPWSRDLAEQLQAAQREAQEQESQVRMRLPFERSLEDREPKFYALPQARSPSKDRDRRPAQRYEREGEA